MGNIFKNTLNEPSYRREFALVAVLMIIQLLHLLDFMTPLPIANKIILDLKIDAGVFSYLISSYTLGAGFTALFCSFFMHILDLKNTLLFAMFILGLSTYLVAFLDNWEFILLARLLAGSIAGLINSLVFAIIASSIPESRRGRATGFIMLSVAIATVIGIPISIILSNEIDWKVPFFIFSAMSFAMIFVARFTIPNIATVSNIQNIGGFKYIFDNHNIYLKLISMVISMMVGHFSVLPYLSLALTNNGGIGDHDLPLIYFFAGLGSTLGALASGFFSDFFGARRAFVIVATLSLIPIMLITNIKNDISIVAACLITGFYYFAMNARLVMQTTLLMSESTPAHRKSFMAFGTSITFFAATASSYFASYFVSNSTSNRLVGYTNIGYFACFLTIVAIICIIILPKKSLTHTI